MSSPIRGNEPPTPPSQPSSSKAPNECIRQKTSDVYQKTQKFSPEASSSSQSDRFIPSSGAASSVPVEPKMPKLNSAQKKQLQARIKEVMHVWEGRKSEGQLGLQLIITKEGEIHLFCRSLQGLKEEANAPRSDVTSIIDQRQIEKIFTKANLDPESYVTLQPFLEKQKVQSTLQKLYPSSKRAERVQFGKRFNQEVKFALERKRELTEQNSTGKLQIVIGKNNQAHLLCRSGTDEDTFQKVSFDQKAQILTINDPELITSILEQAHLAGEVNDKAYQSLQTFLEETKAAFQASLAELSEITFFPPFSERSHRIPEHVKYESIGLKTEVNASIQQAMQEWNEIAKNKGTPRLQLITTSDGELLLSCVEQRKLRKLENAIDDPNQIALKLAEADLSRASCEALTPFVTSLEKSLPEPGGFANFLQSTFSEDLDPVRQALYHLRPESKHAEDIFGVRGVLYKGGELTGKEGSPSGKPCCNDWVGIKANGTIGVIDGPGHGRSELPGRYFAFYEEIFNTFDRTVESCRQTYADSPSMELKDFEQFSNRALISALRPLQREMLRMAEEDVNIAAANKQALIASFQTAKARFFDAQNEPSNAELVELAKQLYDRADLSRLDNIVARFQENNERLESKEPLDEGDRRIIEGNRLMIDYYLAIKDKNYQRLIEMRQALINTQKKPPVMDLFRGLMRQEFSKTQEDFLIRDVFTTLTQASESMLPSTDKMSCPALAFAKVVPTKDGLILVRLQAADASCLITSNEPTGLTSTIDSEHFLSAGFGGDRERGDTRISFQRVTPGQIVSAQTDGTTDFSDKESLTNAVVQSSNPEELFNHLGDAFYAPEKGPHGAIPKSSGKPNEMKPLDLDGIKPSGVDDFSCVRMKIV